MNVLPHLLLGATIAIAQPALCAAAEQVDSCHGERIRADAPRLVPCPDKPNCVSTEAVDPDRRIASIVATGDESQIRTRLLAAIEAQPGSQVEISQPGFVVASFRSRLFGFVDEAQFLVEAGEQRIRFRSGACSGYYDFNVNRNRMESIRTELTH